MINILLIDDDIELCVLLKKFLEVKAMNLDYVHSGKDAESKLFLPKPSRYDLLILDVMMPGENGVEFLKEIRNRSLDIPVIMLTGRGDSMDKVTALTIGADDYICKPCDLHELAARIFAVLRRSKGEKQENTLCLADLEVNFVLGSVRISDNPVDLSEVEFHLLKTLLKNAGKLVFLDFLSMEVLGCSYTQNDRRLSTHISHLRQKLGAYPDGRLRIKTFRGRGFAYVVSTAQA